MEIPCSRDMNDEELIRHIATFYYLTKIEKGILEALGLKNLGMIEVAEVGSRLMGMPMWKTNSLQLHGNAIGKRDSILDLGRYHGNRIIYFFYNPKQCLGDKFFSLFKAKGVLTEIGTDKERALNFVSTWDMDFASHVIVTPAILSIIFAVTWPSVAVKLYNADVQMSVQTGFTIASYVVTTG
jgi:hypothetical protein